MLRMITPIKPIPCPRLWKDFALRGARKAELTITGLGLYRAFLNGQPINNVAKLR